jgi:hypothetical protein
MQQRSKEYITSLRLDKELVFLYQQKEERPSLSELLQFAIMAYLGIESQKEMMYMNILETKRQLSKAYYEKQLREIEMEEEILNMKRKAEEDRRILLKSYMKSHVLINCDYPPYQLIKDPADPRYENNYLVIQKYVETIERKNGFVVPKESYKLLEELYWELRDELVDEIHKLRMERSAAEAAVDDEQQCEKQTKEKEKSKAIERKKEEAAKRTAAALAEAEKAELEEIHRINLELKEEEEKASKKTQGKK